MNFREKISYKIIAISLALLVFVSATGFTLHKHICHCKNETVYSFFPEIFGLSESCCCAETGYDQNYLFQKQLIKNYDCCKNVYLFYKSPVKVQILNSVLKYKISFNGLQTETKIFDIPGKIINPEVSIYRPPPLLLFGKTLITYLHNLKIPFPEM